MARAVAAIVFLGALAACGSAGLRGFHSATKTYSVGEVETAFSKHGLPLVRTQSQRLAGVTTLRHGRGLKSVRVQVAPPGTALVALIRRGGSRPQRARDGNVYVFFPAVDSGAVHAALAELH